MSVKNVDILLLNEHSKKSTDRHVDSCAIVADSLEMMVDKPAAYLNKGLKDFMDSEASALLSKVELERLDELFVGFSNADAKDSQSLRRECELMWLAGLHVAVQSCVHLQDDMNAVLAAFYEYVEKISRAGRWDLSDAEVRVIVYAKCMHEKDSKASVRFVRFANDGEIVIAGHNLALMSLADTIFRASFGVAESLLHQYGLSDTE